jgi:hypothetical protein
MTEIPDAGGDYTGAARSAVLAAVAADLGATHALVAGRPGSWEAEHVRGLVNGTVGWDDEYLEHYKAPLA